MTDAGPGRRWISRISPHDLRHTWASWAYAVDRDPIRLRVAGGWSTINMVERYAHLAPTGLIPEIKQFWRLKGTPRRMQETA